MGKFWGTVIIIAIVVGSIVFGSQFYEEKKAEEARLEQRKKEIQAERKRNEELARQSAPDSGIPPQTYTRNTSRAVSSGRISSSGSSSRRTMIESICREQRCKIIRFSENGSSCYLVVEGPDHSSVSNILDPLIRKGMKDFSEDKKQFRVRTVKGRRVYTAAYNLKF
jgi:hypothetical protein